LYCCWMIWMAADDLVKGVRLSNTSIIPDYSAAPHSPCN
jgi:hypothetical protein